MKNNMAQECARIRMRTFGERGFETVGKQRAQCGVRVCAREGVGGSKLRQLVSVTCIDFIAPTSQDASETNRRHNRPRAAVALLRAIITKESPAVPVSSLQTCRAYVA